MKKYVYKGDQEVSIPTLGIVKPGETVESQTEINHPLFEEVKSKSEGKRIAEQSKEK